MKFRDLKIGDTFDFISPDRMLNSFYERCRKVSARCYRDDKRNRYEVGTINCDVYHVNEPEEG